MSAFAVGSVAYAGLFNAIGRLRREDGEYFLPKLKLDGLRIVEREPEPMVQPPRRLKQK